MNKCRWPSNIRIQALGTMNIHRKFNRNLATCFWDDVWKRWHNRTMYSVHTLELSCSLFSKKASIWAYFGCNKLIISFGWQKKKSFVDTLYPITQRQASISGVEHRTQALTNETSWPTHRSSSASCCHVVFRAIHSHGRRKKQLWPNTISNSQCVFGYTIDESYSKELRRPEKHSNGRKCCHDITLALINGVSLCLYLNNLCEQRRAPQLGLFPW